MPEKSVSLADMFNLDEEVEKIVDEVLPEEEEEKDEKEDKKDTKSETAKETKSRVTKTDKGFEDKLVGLETTMSGLQTSVSQLNSAFNTLIASTTQTQQDKATKDLGSKWAGLKAELEREGVNDKQIDLIAKALEYRWGQKYGVGQDEVIGAVSNVSQQVQSLNRVSHSTGFSTAINQLKFDDELNDADAALTFDEYLNENVYPVLQDPNLNPEAAQVIAYGLQTDPVGTLKSGYWQALGRASRNSKVIEARKTQREKSGKRKMNAGIPQGQSTGVSKKPKEDTPTTLDEKFKNFLGQNPLGL